MEKITVADHLDKPILLYHLLYSISDASALGAIVFVVISN